MCMDSIPVNNNFHFNWEFFTEQNLDNLNKQLKDVPEDNIYGFILINVPPKIYIVDIHYYKYDSKDQGFDLEIYHSNELFLHLKWIDSIKEIKSAKNYKRFQNRTEKILTKFLTELQNENQER